jgi:pimeloyl-ACP methyl ester carboxylesterase
MSASKTFVLVHGSWRGGWCWRRVADRLTARGHRVYTPTLTGLGERSHLLSSGVTLQTHIDDVVNVLKWEQLTNIVLCGHSSSGLVISAVAERVAQGTIGSIVFLDAFLPRDGESLADLLGPVVSSPKFTEGLAASGGVSVPPMPAAAFGTNAADIAWVDAQATAQPYRTIVDKVSLDGARERIARKTFIRATGRENPVHKRSFERLSGDPAWRLYEVACGHEIMLDEPGRLCEILEEVA